MRARIQRLIQQVPRRQRTAAFVVTTLGVFGGAYISVARGPLQPVVSSYDWQHQQWLKDQLEYDWSLRHIEDAMFERLMEDVSEHEKWYGQLPKWLQPHVQPCDLDRRRLIRCLLHNGQLHLLPIYEKYLGALDWTDITKWKEELDVLLAKVSTDPQQLERFASSADYLIAKVPALMDPAHAVSYRRASTPIAPRTTNRT